MVVCHAAQENGVRANRVSILTERTKLQVLHICSLLQMAIYSGVSLHAWETPLEI